LTHLKKTFRQNDFSEKDIAMALKRAFNPGEMKEEEGPEPLARAGLPYVSTISGKITRILQRQD
jgi:hypothetical protein